MALSALHTWVPGELLRSADLNAEFANIRNNPIALISPTTGVITFTTAQTFPQAQFTASSGSTGQGIVVTSGGLLAPATVNASRVSGLVGTISSQNGTFFADHYILNTTSLQGSFVMHSTSAYTLSIGTAGPAPGGRDVAGAFSSTEIHWYMITTGLGSTTVNGIISSQAPPTGPVLPSSYSAWTYLGCSPYTSASTTVGASHQFRGHTALYDSERSLGALNSTTIAAVSVITHVPSNAKRYFFHAYGVGVQADAGGNAISNLEIYAVTSALVYAQSRIQTAVGVGAVQYVGTLSVEMPHTTGRQFFYNHNTANAAAGTANASGAILGYIMPNGDV